MFIKSSSSSINSIYSYTTKSIINKCLFSHGGGRIVSRSMSTRPYRWLLMSPRNSNTNSTGDKSTAATGTGIGAQAIDTDTISSSPINADVISIIKSEHQHVNDLLEMIPEHSDEPEQQQKLTHQIVKELSQHSSTEETLVYPQYLLIEDASGSKCEIESLQEHQEIKESLYELDKVKVGDRSFNSIFERVKAAVLRHVEHEEKDCLPVLERNLTKERLIELGSQWNALKPLQPTRPHPLSPNRPPLNVAAGLAAKPIDEIKDRIQGR